MAQAPRSVRRIGSLEPGAPVSAELIQRSAQALRDLGWVEGRNLYVERRFANGRAESLQRLAAELVRAKVEIIVTGGTPATLAAMSATNTIPIVFRAAGDAVLLGLVSSLPQPGGNVTGFSPSGPEVTAKSMSVLREALPGIRRVGMLEVSSNPYYRAARDQFQQACRSLGFEALFVEVAAAAEIDGAIAQLAHRGTQALYLGSDSLVYDHRFEIMRAALKHRLAPMTDLDDLTLSAGALLHVGAVRRGPQSGQLRRPDSQGSKTVRSCGRATDAVPPDHQPQDSQGAGPRDSAVAIAARRHHRSVRFGSAHRFVHRA